jgi:hypothetical protein
MMILPNPLRGRLKNIETKVATPATLGREASFVKVARRDAPKIDPWLDLGGKARRV